MKSGIFLRCMVLLFCANQLEGFTYSCNEFKYHVSWSLIFRFIFLDYYSVLRCDLHGNAHLRVHRHSGIGAFPLPLFIFTIISNWHFSQFCDLTSKSNFGTSMKRISPLFQYVNFGQLQKIHLTADKRFRYYFLMTFFLQTFPCYV